MQNNEYYIWGAGEYGARLIEFVKGDLVFKAVIDSDSAKHGEFFCGLPVIGYEQAKLEMPGVKVVLALNLTTTAVRKFLLSEGFKENVDFYAVNDFLPRYYCEKNKTMVIKSFDIAVTTVCNMKCEGCQVYMPIAKSHRHLTFKSVAEEIDMVFNYIDRTMNLNCAVGENLLNPELPDICAYIYDNYKERYGYLTVQTNGTVIPSDDALRKFSRSKTMFGVANYPENTDATKKLISKFDEFNVSWYYNSAGGDRSAWVDYGDPRIIRETDSDKLRDLYKECWKPGMGLINGWLFICSIQMWSLLVPEIGEIKPGDGFDLRQNKTEASVEELYKIICREPPSPNPGYLSQCMRCNGVMKPYEHKQVTK